MREPRRLNPGHVRWNDWLPVTITLLLLVGVPAVLFSLLPGTFSLPPKPAECAEDWNAAGNDGLRRVAARGGFDRAHIDGAESKAGGYCLVHLSDRLDPEIRLAFSRWVVGWEISYDEPPGWGPEELWRPDELLQPVSPPNAVVGGDGRIRLRATRS